MIDPHIVDAIADALSDLPHAYRADALAQWNTIGRSVSHRLAQIEQELRTADPPSLDDVAAQREHYADEPAERLMWRLAAGRA